ncbi:hypothetical protein N9F67_00775 [bacterium]|nr:hypothetical protein [bacterium]|tara:strand:+ start:465 stop:659 length:195 start_codon:yes stop_codon:yes gene_type:complete
MKKLTKFQRFLTEGENDDIQAEMFIKIHNILDAGGHDEERADLAEYIRDNFEYDMLKSLGFTEI